MRIFILVSFILGFLFTNISFAELTLLKKEVFAASEESFKRRIYSYDFDISTNGTVHAIYSRPVPNEERSQIIYVSKKVGEDWPAEDQRILIENFGSRDSISTWLTVDDADVIHLSYIVKRDYVDEFGLTHTHGLVYQKIISGVISEKINLSSGGFHTRMQLNNNKAMFVREYENFLNEDGTIRQPPYPKALRLLIPKTDNKNVWQSLVLNLPEAVDYRINNFTFDSVNNKFHLIYGDQDAVFLRETYPSTNPPVTSASTPVPFPAGTGHKLWYASSSNVFDPKGNINTAPTWQTSIVDNSGNISENEFWSDLILDSRGTPFVASYRYATDSRGIQQGTSNIIGHFDGKNWNMQTVAGKTSGASPHRAGMGPKLLIDNNGGFHGIWDNSPDKPIDGENRSIAGTVAGGTTMYRYSPDGANWQSSRQVILPFSVEGNVRAKFYDGKLLIMVLGDARDANVVFAEFNLPAPDEDLFEISSDKMFYGSGETIKIHLRIQGNTTGDLYILAAGPYNIDNSGNLVPAGTNFRYSYLTSGLTWQSITSLSDLQPIIKKVNFLPFDIDFLFPTAKVSPPFSKPARYVVFSASNTPGEPIGKFLTPIYQYEIHVCNLVNCAEL